MACVWISVLPLEGCVYYMGLLKMEYYFEL